MTALEVFQRAAELGVKLGLVDGEIEYRGRLAAIEAIMPDLRANASTIAALLRERASVPCASDAVIAAQTLLRNGRWALQVGPCAFFTGVPASKCLRCGVAWIDHFRFDSARSA